MQDGFWWVTPALFLWSGQVQGAPLPAPTPPANGWPDRCRWLLLAPVGFSWLPKVVVDDLVPSTLGLLVCVTTSRGPAYLYWPGRGVHQVNEDRCT